MLNAADPAFLDALSSAVPGLALGEAGPSYLEEPRRKMEGQPAPLARPANVEEVAAILRLAQERRVGVVPYGGGTGLVGGQVMPAGPVPLILSLEKMDRIRAVYPEEYVLIAEAGAILENIQAAADEVNRLFPLSLASQGSCRIGGNLSTNAGGLNVVRYGNTRELCLGLEAVLPDGSIWNGLSRLRKDNTGYDLRHLLAGAEGTLGIITAASLKLWPRPRARATAMLQVSDPAAAVLLLSLGRELIGEDISTFELIHGTGLVFLSETLPDVRQPIPGHPDWSVLIEVAPVHDSDPIAAIEALFEAGLEAGLVSDGVIAQSEGQRADLWAVREMIPQANFLLRAIASHDVSVPLSKIPEMIARAEADLTSEADVRVNSFGHVGDGNLHINVFAAKGRDRADYANQADRFSEIVHDIAHDLGGSISAEHGIGRFKRADLARYGDPAKLAAMRAIKAALDPNGIMNPGAVL